MANDHTTKALARIHLLIKRRRDPFQPSLELIQRTENTDELRGLCRAAQVMRRTAASKGERRTWGLIEDAALARLCDIAEQQAEAHEQMLRKLQAA